jgi:hypothetical protein
MCMIISHTHKFVYFDIPKTGTSTLDAIFMEHCDGIECKVVDKTKHSRIAPAGTEDYMKIISVRHPIDRIVSYYYWLVQVHNPNLILEKFIDSCIRMSESNASDIDEFNVYRRFPCWKYIEPFGYDYVIHLETMTRDLHGLSFFPDNVCIPHNNASKRRPWEDVITPRLELKIRRWAGKDFAEFGY